MRQSVFQVLEAVSNEVYIGLGVLAAVAVGLSLYSLARGKTIPLLKNAQRDEPNEDEPSAEAKDEDPS